MSEINPSHGPNSSSVVSGPASITHGNENKMLKNLNLMKSKNGLFETGKPVVFEFLRNKEKAGYYGSLYSQDIEPKGMYVTAKEISGPVSDMWLEGTMKFENPLVIKFVDTHQWKKDLQNQFHAKGKPLSNKLLKLGYDAIVTVDENGNSWEIVNLQPLLGKTNYTIKN